MSNLLQQAIAAFDAANSQDPNLLDGQPQELVHAKRLTEWVLKLAPNASEALQLAARCQHICRWESPRDAYPMNRAGYLKWREDLKKFHAEKAAETLTEIGYDEEVIHRVRQLNLKKNIKSDPECQTLEDALCLVFLEFQFDDLIARYDTEKMVKIVQKTWAKMSEPGHQAALTLDYSEAAQKTLKLSL